MPLVTITRLHMLSPDEHKRRPILDPRFQMKEATVKQWQFNRFLYELVVAQKADHDSRQPCVAQVTDGSASVAILRSP